MCTYTSMEQTMADKIQSHRNEALGRTMQTCSPQSDLQQRRRHKINNLSSLPKVAGAAPQRLKSNTGFTQPQFI